MRIFLDAAAKTFDEVEILFYTSPSLASECQSAEYIKKNIKEAWGIDARITICPSASKDDDDSKWQHYILPIFNFINASSYSDISKKTQIDALEECLIRNPSVIFAHRLSAMCPLMLIQRPLPPIVFDLDDIEHIKLFRNIILPPFWLGKLLYYFHLPALIRGERRAMKLATKTFICSTHDRDYLTNTWKLKNISIIPNSVTIPRVTDQYPDSKVLTFIGSYTYAPNVSAADYLLKEVWPLIRNRVPDASLIIAGNRPENIPAFHAENRGVSFPGFITNLDDLYRRSQLVTCPILSGGGTRVKILEAAAYGRAIVSTSIGAEGLELNDGTHLAIRDGAEDLAEECVLLLNDLERCRMLGANARLVIEHWYDRSKIIELVKNEYLSIRN